MLPDIPVLTTSTERSQKGKRFVQPKTKWRNNKSSSKIGEYNTQTGGGAEIFVPALQSEACNRVEPSSAQDAAPLIDVTSTLNDDKDVTVKDPAERSEHDSLASPPSPIISELDCQENSGDQGDTSPTEILKLPDKLPGISDDVVVLPNTVGNVVGHRPRFDGASAPNSISTSLFLLGDDEVLSPLECLIRKNVEFFEADPLDVQAYKFKHVRLHQVGIRCRLCAHIHPEDTTTGAFEYPAKYDEIGPAAIRLADMHLMQTCPYVSEPLRLELRRLRSECSTNGGDFPMMGGCWEAAAKETGVRECDDSGNGGREGTHLIWSQARKSSGEVPRSVHKEYYDFRLDDTTLKAATNILFLNHEEPSSP